MAMVKLQEDLICILNGEKQRFEPIDGASLRENCFTDKAEEHDLDPFTTHAEFLHRHRIHEIKSFAETMMTSGHEQEFCQAFIGFSRATFSLYLTMLGMEELSSDKVCKIGWNFPKSRVQKWRCAMKNFIGSYLGHAKDAFDQILGEYGHIKSDSFIESSQASVMSLLNLGHAIIVKPHEGGPEWLFLYVDMYEDLASIIPKMDALFPEEIGSFIHAKFYNLLKRLRDCAKVVLAETGNVFGSCNISAIPYPSGSVFHLSKYIMNYILCLEPYDGTLNSLLEEEGKEKMDRDRPLTAYVQSLTSVLEARLDILSNAYVDMSWKHIFMMNNIHYMVRKIINSKVYAYFGDEWIRNHVVKFRQHAMSYQRVTWTRVISLISHANWRAASNSTLRARCRAFTAAFEEVYERQTGLWVPDIHLREELRFLASETVVHVYSSFLRRFSSDFGEKHIIYTAEDLLNYILDLLEGSSKSLNQSRRWKSWIMLLHR